MNEADTCRKFVVPKLQSSGWDTEPHRINEQVTFTDGRIIVTGRKARRRPGKRADYILRYRPDMPIAVVEAKPEYKTPGEGLQQAKDYADILGLKFAFATNGLSIVEFDYTTGKERVIGAFPTPELPTAMPKQSCSASIKSTPTRCVGRWATAMPTWSRSIPIMFAA